MGHVAFFLEAPAQVKRELGRAGGGTGYVAALCSDRHLQGRDRRAFVWFSVLSWRFAAKCDSQPRVYRRAFSLKQKPGLE